MLKPMSPSSFFAPLTSIKTTGRFVFCPLGKVSELSLKEEDAEPGEGVRNGRENPPPVFCPAKYYMFSHTVRHILYTNIAKKNIDIVIFFFYSLYKGMNLWSWLKRPFEDGFLFSFCFFFVFKRAQFVTSHSLLDEILH